MVAERETRALRAFVRRHPVRVTSRLAMVEVAHAVAQHEPRARALLPSALAGLAVIELSAEIATAAGEIAPVSLRTLDAIHVASALSIRDELAAFVTYDDRQADAAAAAGLRVQSPA